MATRNPRLEKLSKVFCEAPGTERNLYDSLKKLLADSCSPERCDSAAVVIDSPIPGTRCAPDLTLYLLGENGRPMVTASHVFASIEVKRGNFLARAEDAELAEKQKYITSTTRHFYLIDQKRVIGYEVRPGGEMVKRKSWTWTKLAQDDVFNDAFFPIGAEFARVSSAIQAFKGGQTGFASVDVTDDTRRAFRIETDGIGVISLAPWQLSMDRKLRRGLRPGRWCGMKMFRRSSKQYFGAMMASMLATQPA